MISVLKHLRESPWRCAIAKTLRSFRIWRNEGHEQPPNRYGGTAAAAFPATLTFAGDVMNLAGWLQSLGLERYAAVFHENEIDETVLPTLTTEDLKDLGVKSVTPAQAT